MKITGYASVFGNQDAKHDIMVKGAFEYTLNKWAQGSCMPVLYQHSSNDVIGFISKIEEDNYGLLVTVELDETFDKTKSVITMLEKNMPLYFSIGYRVKECYFDDHEVVRCITSAILIEISLVLIPANPLCVITSKTLKV